MARLERSLSSSQARSMFSRRVRAPVARAVGHVIRVNQCHGAVPDSTLAHTQKRSGLEGRSVPPMRPATEKWRDAGYGLVRVADPFPVGVVTLTDSTLPLTVPAPKVVGTPTDAVTAKVSAVPVAFTVYLPLPEPPSS